MANLDSDERNIVEADEVNWRLVVYPLLAIIVVLVGGFAIYYYQLNQREQTEVQARSALLAATTPDAMAKVADDFPHTTQASIALINAADAAYAARDYATAQKDYQRVTSTDDTPPELRDSARLGLASAQEAGGHGDDAIQSYLEVAHKGAASPFAPAAYYQVAQIYMSRQDTKAEADVLQQEVRLGGESPFVQQAAAALKSLQDAAPSAATLAAPTEK